jgi:hypothetical protein
MYCEMSSVYAHQTIAAQNLHAFYHKVGVTILVAEPVCSTQRRVSQGNVVRSHNVQFRIIIRVIHYFLSESLTCAVHREASNFRQGKFCDCETVITTPAAASTWGVYEPTQKHRFDRIFFVRHPDLLE